MFEIFNFLGEYGVVIEKLPYGFSPEVFDLETLEGVIERCYSYESDESLRIAEILEEAYKELAALIRHNEINHAEPIFV